MDSSICRLEVNKCPSCELKLKKSLYESKLDNVAEQKKENNSLDSELGEIPNLYVNNNLGKEKFPSLLSLSASIVVVGRQDYKTPGIIPIDLVDYLTQVEQCYELNYLESHLSCVSKSIHEHEQAFRVLHDRQNRGKRVDSKSSKNPVFAPQLPYLKGHADLVSALKVLPDGRIASGSWDTSIRVWNLKTRKQDLILAEHGYSVWCIEVIDETHIISASADHTLRVWSLKTGTTTAILRGHTAAVYKVLVFPELNQVVSCSQDGTIRFWSIGTYFCFAVLNAHSSPISSISYFTAPLPFLSHPPLSVMNLSAAPSPSYPSIVPSKETMNEPINESHNSHSSQVDLSKNRLRLVSGSHDGLIRVWDFETKALLMELRGHDSAVFSIQAVNDGANLISSSKDSTVIVWSLSDGSLANKFTGHSSPVLAVCPLPSNPYYIVSGSSLPDAALKLWKWTSPTAHEQSVVASFSRGITALTTGGPATEPLLVFAVARDIFYIPLPSPDRPIDLSSPIIGQVPPVPPMSRSKKKNKPPTALQLEDEKERTRKLKESQENESRSSTSSSSSSSSQEKDLPPRPKGSCGKPPLSPSKKQPQPSTIDNNNNNNSSSIENTTITTTSSTST